jgi:hypothetical protein
MNTSNMLNAMRRGAATAFFFKPDVLLYSVNDLIEIEHLLLGEHFKLCLSAKTGFWAGLFINGFHYSMFQKTRLTWTREHIGEFGSTFAKGGAKEAKIPYCGQALSGQKVQVAL